MSEQPQNQPNSQPQNPAPNPPANHGKRIGDIVHSALASGDLSRLSDLGPAVQQAVSDIPLVKNAGVTNHHVNQNTNANTNAAYSGPPQPKGHPYQSQLPQRPVWQGSAMPAVRPRQSIPSGIVPTVFGVLGMVAFGLGALVFGGLSMVLLSSIMGSFAWACGALFVGSIALTAHGSGKSKRARRLRKYVALLEQKSVATFDELAAATGCPPGQIKKDIRKARAKGLLPQVRTDADETCLMLGENAYQQYLETEKSRQQREEEEAQRQLRLSNPATASMEAFKNEGERTMRLIRDANDAIPGEEISDKLSRLEATCDRIFTYVQAHPDKLPETRRFMDYYLPTTLKLVEKYRQYEEMDFQPENVKQAKWDIERALDTIDTAFNNLLEGLFAPDTLDVSTDIEVLQQMLEQEGLTGRKFEIDTSNTTTITLE